MKRIEQIRRLLALSQAELGKHIGCTQGNVGHYERGQTFPPEKARALIAFAATRGLQIGFDHVYGGSPLPELIEAEGAPAVPSPAEQGA